MQHIPSIERQTGVSNKYSEKFSAKYRTWFLHRRPGDWDTRSKLPTLVPIPTGCTWPEPIYGPEPIKRTPYLSFGCTWPEPMGPFNGCTWPEPIKRTPYLSYLLGVPGLSLYMGLSQSSGPLTYPLGVHCLSLWAPSLGAPGLSLSIVPSYPLPILGVYMA